MCIMKDCTGVENFVFARGTLISSQADVTFPYGSERDGPAPGTSSPAGARGRATN